MEARRTVAHWKESRARGERVTARAGERSGWRLPEHVD